MEIINPSESVPFSGTYQLDDTLNVTWTTNLTSYSINLRQQFPTDSDESTGELILLYNKAAGQPEESDFLWNISSSNLFNITNATFQIFVGSDDAGTQPEIQNPIFFLDLNNRKLTQKFRIINPKSSQTAIPITTLTTDSSASPTDTSPSSSFINSKNILISSTATTATASAHHISSAIAGTTVKSGSKHKNVNIGIKAGLAAFIVLAVLVAFVFKYRQKRQTIEKSAQPSCLSSSPIPPQSNQKPYFEIDPVKAELPTPFNVVRSMGATFLAKFELPGKDHEKSNSEAPFELSAD